MFENADSFNDILQIFETTDFVSGVFLFRQTTEWTWKEKLARMNALLCPLMSLVLMYGTIHSGKYPTVLGWIFVSSRLVIEMTVYTLVYSCLANKKQMNDLFEWCEKMYVIRRTFHPKVQVIAEEKVRWMHRWSSKMLQFYVNSFIFNILFMTIGITTIGWMLPDTIYPKFTLPLPYFLPFENQESWTVFIVTFIMQIVLSIVIACMTVGALGIVFAAAIFIVNFLEIIDSSIKMMHNELEQLLTTHRPVQQELREWTKTLVDMICGVKEVFNTFNEVFSLFFLMMEFSCYASVFTFGLLIIVVKKQVMFGMCASLIIVAGFLTLNYISVIIMGKFSKIMDGLYDCPWYALAPSERKSIHRMMLCGQFKIGLQAAGMHRLDLQLFLTVLKTAYVNCLVLKNMVTA